MATSSEKKAAINKGSILVVDDEELVRNALAERLRREGHAVESASGGVEALELTASKEYDVILLDLKMKDLDGIEVLRELQARRYPAEVVMLTAYPTVSTAVEALKIGALDYLLKPWKMPDLSQRISQALEVGRQRDKGALDKALDLLAKQNDFTRKQVEVCKLLIGGKANAQIALTMDISENTVKTHLKKIFDKLGVDSRTGLVARVLEHIRDAG